MAEGTVWTNYEVDGGVEVQVVVTHAADGTFTPVVFKQNDQVTPLELGNKYLFCYSYYFGGTAPTGDTDLYVREHSATGRDVLGGSGVNMIDAATNYEHLQPWVNSNDSVVPIYGRLYLDPGDSAANCTYTLIFKFINMPGD